MLSFERKAQLNGCNFIAGMDEAGRGPLAGPVFVACVVMPLEEDKIIPGINDSKKLSEKKREELFEKIKETALAYSVILIDEKTIDKINILEATKLGMKKAYEALEVPVDMLLVDAVKNLDVDCQYESIIKGDAKSYSIAAASILAKVTRDQMIIELDKKYPEYNFKKHKGYGTKEHIEAIKKIGPCAIHRKTFIKNFVNTWNT